MIPLDRVRALLDGVPGLWVAERADALSAAAPDLARDVISLADALRAAEARAVAAEAERDAAVTGHAALAAAVDAEVRRERDMWQAQIETTTTDAADALDMIDDLVRHAVLHHPLPWRIEDDWTREVTAKDGTIIAKCMTHARAAAIIATAEKIRAELDAPMCDTCGKPATCGGEYEGEAGHACDDCCGHGNEDGHCEPVGDVAADAGVR